MRTFINILMLLTGIALAAVTAGGVRAFDGGIGTLSVAAFVIVLSLFTLSSERTLALAAGMGIGFDALGGYPYLTWTLILLSLAALGVWLSRTYITNRSLFALIILGTVIRIALLGIQLIVSNAAGGAFSSDVRLHLDPQSAFELLKAFGIELAAYYVFFLLYLRFRGRAAGTLAHVPSYRRP